MSGLANPVFFFLVLGLAAVLIEVVLLQLTTFWLLFIGIGALLASFILYLFPSMGWGGGVTLFILLTVAVTALLYKPLRKFQKKPSSMPGNDALGQQVTVIEPISPDNAGKVIWSGADWDAKLIDGESKTLEIDDKAEIIEVSGITLLVK